MTPEEIRDYNARQKMKKDKYCPKCNTTYKKVLDQKCCICRSKLIELTENTPKCPTCQSINIKKISTARKAVHGAAFGIFSKTAFSQFECCNCGYKW